MASSLIDRVRTVMEQVAGNQAAFGAMIGVSGDKLSKALAGRRRFTSLELALIAEAGQVTVDWLLSGNAPTRPMLAARSATGSSVDSAAVAKIADRYCAAFDVLELLGELPSVPDLPDVAAKLPSREQGELLADQVVDLLAQDGHGSIADLSVAELAAAFEETFGTNVEIGRLPEGLDGLAWQTDRHRLILVAITKHWTRQRFTLAHELGHVVAGDAQQVLVDQGLSPGLDKDPSEIKANSFAAALLMPQRELRTRVKGRLGEQAFAELVVTYKVSPSAMAVRLKSLGLVGSADFGRLRKFTSAQCHQMAGTFESYLEQVNAALAARLPNLLVGSLFSAYQAGETTLRPLAGLLDVDVDALYEVLVGSPEPSGGDETVYSL